MTTINQFNIYKILFTDRIHYDVIFYKTSPSQGMAKHLMKERVRVVVVQATAWLV